MYYLNLQVKHICYFIVTELIIVQRHINTEYINFKIISLEFKVWNCVLEDV